MTYERDSVNGKILDAALTDALAETALVLAGCGASAEEKERVRKAWAPVAALVRGTVTVSVPDPADIEREYIEARALGLSVEAYRGADAVLPPPKRPMRKLAIVRKPSTAECYAAATDDGSEPKEIA